MDRQFQTMDQQLNDVFSHYNRLMPSENGVPTLERLPGSNPSRQQGQGTPSQLVEGFRLKNPVITNPDGSRQLKLQFDVRDFKPEEVEVKTVDKDRLVVHAKQQSDSENSLMYREYQRQFMLPEGTDLDRMRSFLSPEGVLTVEAPLPKLEIEAPKERAIPIQHQTSTQEAVTKK
jgi:HSP20 family molecular chaperone IbpA